jgi:PKD repeat protein/lysophospholipase L1-like esterase
MKQVTFIILLAACLYAKGEAPTNITSSVDYTCIYNQSGSALTNPMLYVFTNGLFSYDGYPTNTVNVLARWPQNAQGQGYSGCSTNAIGAEGRGIITNLNGAPQPGLDVSFTINAQEFELHLWDQSDDYVDIYDEDDGSLTTFSCSENDDPQWYQIQYATKKTRHLRVYFECNTEESIPGIIFNGVNVGQGDSISADTNWTPGMMVEGDSYCQGFNPGTGKWFYDSYATLAGFLTNGGDFHVMADGIGGSGFLANGEGTNYASRFLTDVLPYTNLFRFFVLQASINDAAVTNSSQQLYATNLGGLYYDAVTNMIGMAQKYLPAQEIAVLGIPRDPGTQGGTNIIHNVDARNAAAAMGVPFFDAMDQLSIPSGDVGWDGVHLSQAGYQLVANYLNGQMADTFTDYPATSYFVLETNQGPPTVDNVSLTLSVTNFGAIGDGETFSVNTVSNSTVVSVSGTNVFSASDIGKVIEVFGAGPWIDYSNWGPVVTQQDIICLITNVTDGTNLSLSIPCGYTMNAYCVVGSNNGPAFQAAVNNATSLLDSGQATNVVISIPAGTYLMVSSNVLNPNYQMISISDTHPALIISSGGITLQGQSATNTILMGCGAGMNHLVQGSLTWISPAYAPYVPMRDTLIECRGPVANNQFPLVFQNLTMDGGLTNGAQAYNYWTIIQANGEGWDTTHHAVADWDGYITYQMNQVKEFTNCIFQHWRGEICICWTADITNALTDWENCQFLDGNATADNMYYGQKINNCVFNGVGKVMEYYQNNGWTNSSIMENCLVTNISEVAGPANVHVDCALTGAVTNRTMPSFTFFNNQFYDNVGMELFSLNAAENIFFISNTFDAAGPAINLTGIGQQPSDGTEVWYMTNIWVVGNSFNCSSPLSIGYSVVEDLMCSNNTGFTLMASIGYATNNILSGNTGPPNNGIYYDLGTGPGSPPQGVIQAGQYFVDETNNNWSMPGNDSIDGGDYFPTDSIISYGNGPVHLLRNAGGVFHLDDTHPGMNPGGATLQVFAVTWNGANITNFYTSSLGSGGVRLTITNNAPPVTFYWNGNNWVVTNSVQVVGNGPTVQFTSSTTNGYAPLTVQFNCPAVDSTSNAIANWNWNFGDGSTSTGQNPSHVYSTAGTFSPSLIFTNSSGAVGVSTGAVITVSQMKLGLFSTASKELILAWPTNISGYALQYTTNLSPPVVWNTFSTAPFVVSGQNFVTNFMSGPQMFFRLAANLSELVLSSTQPELSLAFAGGKLVLAWPTNAVGFVLQSTTNLVPPMQWNPVSSTPAIINGQYTVTNSISDSRMFFRLAN